MSSPNPSSQPNAWPTLGDANNDVSPDESKTANPPKAVKKQKNKKTKKKTKTVLPLPAPPPRPKNQSYASHAYASSSYQEKAKARVKEWPMEKINKLAESLWSKYVATHGYIENGTLDKEVMSAMTKSM